MKKNQVNLLGLQKEKYFQLLEWVLLQGDWRLSANFLKTCPKIQEWHLYLIQHLDPTHASNIAELLARNTEIPVNEATNKMKIKPDHIYIIPPSWNMTINNRTLLLIEPHERPGISHNIDLFFSSMANDLGDNSIVIILSGTGTDGTEGARTVKAKRGVVLAEDPDTAKYDGMPDSVISKGIADFVQPVEELPGELINYVKKYFGKKYIEKVDKKRLTH
ncbi:MAG: chemotaxis protein CheB [Actinomycetota bacterium]|nr:chemotaxis protein CheB [Actinomycetota bacterium]